MDEAKRTTVDGKGAAKKRAWYRWHFSTYLVLLAALFIAVIVVVPGEDGTGRDCGENDSLYGQRSVIHGWPVWFVRRHPQVWWNESGATAAFAWELTDSLDEFRAGALLIDCAVAAVGLSLIVALAEWRRRRRRSERFQISLRQLFALVTVAAAACAVFARQQKADQEMRRRLTEVQKECNSGLPIAVIPQLPIWCRSLVGDETLTKLGMNVPEKSSLMWRRTQHENLKHLVETFPDRFDLIIDQPLSDDDLALIAEMGDLRIVTVYHATDPIVCRLSQLPNVIELNLGLGNQRHLSAESFAALSRMPRLKDLSIAEADGRTTDSDFVGMEKLTNIEELALPNAKIVAGEIRHLAALKQLQRLELKETKFPIAEISLLRPLNHLEKLDLTYTNTNDDDLPVLAALPTLKVLNLESTQVSAKADDLLRPSLPDLDLFTDDANSQRQSLQTSMALVKSRQSTTLEVVGCMLTDDDLSELRVLKGLRCLEFDSRYLGDRIFDQIVHLGGIETLRVDKTRITAHALKKLADLPALTELEMNAHQVDAEVVEALKKLRALRTLRIHQVDDTTLTDEFVDKLQQSLPNCNCFYDPIRN